MKTLLIGIAVGVAAKYWWDSPYSANVKQDLDNWLAKLTAPIDRGIERAEEFVENKAEKIDNALNS